MGNQNNNAVTMGEVLLSSRVSLRRSCRYGIITQ
jgi:hypothetical protein